MKKLLFAALMAASFTASAATQCWIKVGTTSFDVYKISQMDVTNYDSVTNYVTVTFDSGHNYVRIAVPNHADGQKLIKQIVAASQACK